MTKAIATVADDLLAATLAQPQQRRGMQW